MSAKYNVFDLLVYIFYLFIAVVLVKWGAVVVAINLPILADIASAATQLRTLGVVFQIGVVLPVFGLCLIWVGVGKSGPAYWDTGDMIGLLFLTLLFPVAGIAFGTMALANHHRWEGWMLIGLGILETLAIGAIVASFLLKT